MRLLWAVPVETMATKGMTQKLAFCSSPQLIVFKTALDLQYLKITLFTEACSLPCLHKKILSARISWDTILTQHNVCVGNHNTFVYKHVYAAFTKSSKMTLTSARGKSYRYSCALTVPITDKIQDLEISNKAYIVPRLKQSET